MTDRVRRLLRDRAVVPTVGSGGVPVDQQLAHPGAHCELGFSYGSDTNDHFLTVDELATLIEQET